MPRATHGDGKPRIQDAGKVVPQAYVSGTARRDRGPATQKTGELRRRAIAFGTFDGIHAGHRHFLDEASSYGDLRVVVALDATVGKVKGRPPLHDEQSRLLALKDAGYDAVLGDPVDRYAVIEDYRPDVVCLGYDQQAFTERLEAELKNRGIDAEIVRLEAHRPETYKSSKLNDHPHTR